MATFIESVLDSYSLNAISESLTGHALFEDGKPTAGKTAKRVKNNVQAQADSTTQAVLKMIENALLDHAVFQAAALPSKFAKMMINRYDPGMDYGPHVDEAYIAGTRTDLSFTLFLSDPESYEGGELIIQKDDGDEVIKLPKGALYLYPSNSIHRVTAVTSGSRLAAVGWVQSRVRLDEHRQILFDISQALTKMPDNDANRDARLQMLKIKNNLLRLWAE
jgi:PKHD-type hydroxylase